MKRQFYVVRRFFLYAWRGSLSYANNWSALAGAIILFLFVKTGIHSDFRPPDGTTGMLEVVLLWFAATWVLFFCIRLIYAPVALLLASEEELLSRDAEIDTLRSKYSAASLPSHNTIPQALELIFKDEPKLNYVEPLAGGLRVRMIKVALRNVGDGFLAECVVRLKDVVSAPQGSSGIFEGVMSPASTLARGETKYVNVCSYHEVLPNQDEVHDVIHLSIAYSGGLIDQDYGARIAPPPSERPATILIEASSADCEPCNAAFIVWIDRETKKLKFKTKK